MQTLDECRAALEKIDKQIVGLLNNRMKVVADVGTIKRKQGISPFQKQREIELVEKICKSAENPILRDYIPEIYNVVFNASKLSQRIQNGMKLPFGKVGIIGLGLMGGSIAKAAKAADPEVRIYALSKTKKPDETTRLIDKIYGDITDFINACEIIFIATPLSQIEETAKQIAGQANKKKKILIIDIGSTKKQIASVFEKITTKNAEFLATHPMAGADKTGFVNSSIGLFNNKPWIITPHKKNSREAIGAVQEFVSRLGAIPQLLTPEVHDKRIAAVSHLTFLLASYLTMYIADKRPETAKLAGPGFVSTTRVASGSAQMHTEIYKENYENIKAELNDFLAYISAQNINPDNSFEFFTAAKNNRESLTHDEKN